MPTIAEKLIEVEEVLRAGEVAEPRRESSLLLALALKKDKSFLFAHPEYSLTESENEHVDRIADRRAAREPYQYIAGTQEFYGLDFVVTDRVLIPRPETELLVTRSIELLAGSSTPKFCEIGAGSGCICISILHNVPSATALGVDISADALEIARINAERNGVTERLTLRESDLFSSFADEHFDLIVSNPPYVPLTDLEELQPEVRDHEPHTALFGGPDGLTIIKRIVDEAPRFMRMEGHLLLEIGIEQSERVAEMFDRTIWSEPVFLPDLQGIPRVVVARSK
jgi:release factor glutamine methyltransferase